MLNFIFLHAFHFKLSENMKIYELPKALNPEAEEWRPTPQPLVLIQPAPPLKLHFLLQLGCLSYNVCSNTAYTLSFPANHYLHKAAAPICQEDKMVIRRRRKCPKSPCHDVFKAPRMCLPPRQRRAKKKPPPPPPPPPPRQDLRYNKPKNDGGSTTSMSVHPQPPKQEWRLKNASISSLANLKVSGGDGSATASPPPPHSSGRTTLMIKNIPNQIRRDFMLKFLDSYCRTYSLEYDFFYLPIDFWMLGNLGYAFVNLTSAAAAMKMKKNLQNYKWGAIYTEHGEPIFFSNKVCEMTWARIQGKEALIRRFQNSSFDCNDIEFLPALLDPPRNGLDPNPPPPVNLGRLRRRSLSV